MSTSTRAPRGRRYDQRRRRLLDHSRQDGSGAELREESPNRGPKLARCVRSTKRREVGRQVRRRVEGRSTGVREVQKGQRGEVLPQVPQQVGSQHALDPQAADHQVAPGQRKEAVGGQRAGLQGHAVTVATQSADDPGGRDGVIVGNDNALSVEGVCGGGNHWNPLDPDRPGVAGRIKKLNQYNRQLAFMAVVGFRG